MRRNLSAQGEIAEYSQGYCQNGAPQEVPYGCAKPIERILTSSNRFMIESEVSYFLGCKNSRILCTETA